MLDPRTVGLRGALNSLNRRRLHVGPSTLADRIFAPALLMDIVLVLCGAAIVSLAAQFVVPLWPVPSTGQITGVLLVGFGLGAVRGGLALLLYLALGALGLPVFNQGASGLAHLSGQTGGYLVGFVVAAVLAGLCAARRWDRRLPTAFTSVIAIVLVVYTFGVVHLMAYTGSSITVALEAGFYPLIVSGLVKVLVVAAIMVMAWRVDRRLTARAAATPRRESLLA